VKWNWIILAKIYLKNTEQIKIMNVFLFFFFSDMKYFDDTRNEIVITFLMPLALHDQPRAPPYPTLEIQPLKTFNQSSIFLFSLFSFF